MKLSIVTVNYNNAEGLRQTIESVLNQSFTDFEYLVIDGASTDGSTDIIRQYADKISYWVSEPDKGIYQAMNKGIRKAQGEYLQFLNSGDVFYDSNVLTQTFSRSYPEDMLTGSIVREYPNGKKVMEKGWAYVREKQGRQMTLFDFFVGYLPHQATFIRKKVFEQYGLYDEQNRIVSDRLFFMKTIGLNNVSIRYLDIVMVCFDMGGISNTDPKGRIRENEAAEERLIPASLLMDYRYFQKVNQDIHKALKYKFTFRLCRFINRLVTVYEIILGKNTQLD
ncbi:MAG: glycosyltransferase [Candidatus Symbiothrix sp.]|jgi:glycosyltransferase involved in cell wall biosynthesis|nr:glycosyltransferase [Candidatus Symbiothrix sp.]